MDGFDHLVDDPTLDHSTRHVDDLSVATEALEIATYYVCLSADNENVFPDVFQSQPNLQKVCCVCFNIRTKQRGLIKGLV